MLDAEEARAALDAIGDEHWRKAAERRVRKLRRSYRKPAEVMLEDEVWADAKARERFRARVDEAGAAIDELTDDDRRQVIDRAGRALLALGSQQEPLHKPHASGRLDHPTSTPVGPFGRVHGPLG